MRIWKGVNRIMGNFNINDHVLIVADNDWHGMIGIVRDISHNNMQIFCIKKPAHVYFVNENNIDDIELLGSY